MKWFKHKTCARRDETMVLLMDRFGLEGYAVYWIILEQIAEQMDDSNRCSLTLPTKVFAKNCQISPKKFRYITEFLEKYEKISVKFSENLATVTCPKLLKIRDEYTKKQRRKSGQSPDIVRTKSSLDTEYRVQSKSTSSSPSGEEEQPDPIEQPQVNRPPGWSLVPDHLVEPLRAVVHEIRYEQKFADIWKLTGQLLKKGIDPEVILETYKNLDLSGVENPYPYVSSAVREAASIRRARRMEAEHQARKAASAANAANAGNVVDLRLRRISDS